MHMMVLKSMNNIKIQYKIYTPKKYLEANITHDFIHRLMLFSSGFQELYFEHPAEASSRKGCEALFCYHFSKFRSKLALEINNRAKN